MSADRRKKGRKEDVSRRRDLRYLTTRFSYAFLLLFFVPRWGLRSLNCLAKQLSRLNRESDDDAPSFPAHFSIFPRVQAQDTSQMRASLFFIRVLDSA